MIEARAVTAANPGSRVPIWRKTRGQQVDEKVERMFESYRMIDQAIINEREKRGQGRPEDGGGLDRVNEEIIARRNKYF